MISSGTTEDHPRLGIAAVRSLLPTDSTEAALDIDFEVDGQRRVRRVMLEATHLPRRGGLRWWWRCPVCSRRRAHLYLLSDLECRVCGGVKYASQYLSRREGPRDGGEGK